MSDTESKTQEEILNEADQAAKKRAGLESEREDLFKTFESMLQRFDSDSENERMNAFRLSQRKMKEINKIHEELGYAPISFRQIFEQAAKGGSVVGTEEELYNAVHEYQIANAELKENEIRLLAKIDRLEALIEKFKTDTVRKLMDDGIINKRALKNADRTLESIAAAAEKTATLIDTLRLSRPDAANPGVYPQILDHLLANDTETLADARLEKEGITAYLTRMAGMPADHADLTLLRHIMKAQKEAMKLYAEALGSVGEIEAGLDILTKALGFIKAGQDGVDAQAHNRVLEMLEKADAENSEYRKKFETVESIENQVSELTRQKETLERQCEQQKKLRERLENEYGELRSVHAEFAGLKDFLKKLQLADSQQLVVDLSKERAEHIKTKAELSDTKGQLAASTQKYTELAQRMTKWVMTEEEMTRQVSKTRWLAAGKLTTAFAIAAGAIFLGVAGAGLLQTSASLHTMVAGFLGTGALVGVCAGAFLKVCDGEWGESVGLGCVAGVISGVVGVIGVAFGYGFGSDGKEAPPAPPTVIEEPVQQGALPSLETRLAANGITLKFA